jgi:hypothetical protein
VNVALPTLENSLPRTSRALIWLGWISLGGLPLLIAIFPADAAGWVLLYLTYALFMAYPEIRRNRRISVAAIIILTAHHLVAFVNAFVVTVVGADKDAVDFQRQASETASGSSADALLGAGSVLYVHFVAFFYHLFGTSLFLGEELSVLAFTLSCIVLIRLCDLMGISHFRAGLLLLFGLSLSGLIFLSVTLRESWQVLFVLLSTYWALCVRSRASWLNIIFLILSAVGLGLLHQGLAPYAVFLVLVSIYWGIGARHPSDILWKRALVVIVSVFLIVLVAASIKQLGGASAALATGNALEYAQDYRLHSTQDARAAYGVALDASTPAHFAATLPPVFIQYMFAPFPWQISSPLDIEAMLEGGVRLALLYTSWCAWRQSIGEARSRNGFLLGLFLTMELLWALGTINWGTAVRHHILAYSLLVLTGGPGLIAFLARAFRALLLPGFMDRAESQL